MGIYDDADIAMHCVFLFLIPKDCLITVKCQLELFVTIFSSIVVSDITAITARYLS